MDLTRFRQYLDIEFALFRSAVVGGSLAAKVPSCPEWTVDDLVRHVGVVYLHQSACMRLGVKPRPWPPAGIDEQQPLEVLDVGFTALCSELDGRDPNAPSFTWYAPDQTVGFWFRRMAHETLIHRVDAELAVGHPISPIANDLAVDGVDEVLTHFLEYECTTWPDDFTETLGPHAGRVVRVTADEAEWDVTVVGATLRVSGPGSQIPDAGIGGPSSDVLLSLWNRRAHPELETGAQEVLAAFRAALVSATQ